MIERLILHIGQSKTGTSALQALLSGERETLENSGILFPDIILHGKNLGLLEHNAFAESISAISRYPHLDAEQWTARFIAQIKEKKAHTLLLSAESFFGTPQIWTLSPTDDFLTLHRQKVERLASLLPAKKTHIVLYLRRQDLWLESAIGHIIRYEGLLGRRVYENNEQITALLSPHLDYLRLADMWQEVLAPEQFSIVPYEHDALKGGDTALDFLERTGLDEIIRLTDNVPKKLENRSWSAECLTIKQELNKKEKSKTRERAIISILNTLNERDDLPRTRFMISQEIKDRVLEEHKADNRRLAEKYHGPIGSFFSHPEPEKNQNNALEKPDPDSIFSVLRAFEKEYYRPARKLAELAHSLKAYGRNKHPGLYSGIKRIVKPATRKSA